MNISALDDYPAHQGSSAISVPAISNENFYDRYFANGFSVGGGYYFAVSLGRYAVRGLRDAAFTVQVDGVHYSFFVSASDGPDPSDMRLGPFELCVERPLRVMTIKLTENDGPLRCELHWYASSAPICEPRYTKNDSRDVAREDTTRWTQFGCWEGWFEIGATRYEVVRSECLGVKDRSWGVRSWGSSEREIEQLARERKFWNWIPLNFGKFGLHFLRLEEEGEVKLADAFEVPLFRSVESVPTVNAKVLSLGDWDYDYSFDEPGHRINGGIVHLLNPEVFSKSKEIRFGEPFLTAWTRAIGYNHPYWYHGSRHGELATGHERWAVKEVDYRRVEFALMHHVVKAQYDDTVGFGFIEQFII